MVGMRYLWGEESGSDGHEFRSSNQISVLLNYKESIKI